MSRESESRRLPGDTPAESRAGRGMPRGRFPWPKAILLVALVAATAAAWVLFRDELTLARLARHEAALAAWRREHPLAVYGAALLLYVVVTGLSIPGATPLSLAFGWFFGFWRGLVLVSFGSTAGATVAMLLSRYLFRDAVRRRFGDRLAKINDAVEREGAWYLVSLRLIWAVPFFVLNLLMGLTPMRVTTYWWASQLGMLPVTALVVYAGSQVPTAHELAERGAAGIVKPQMVVALVLVALVPLALRRLVRRTRAG